MEFSLPAIFGAGVLTLATPCILPMLPVYLSLLLGAGLDSAHLPGSRTRLVSASLMFVAGFSAVFMLLGLGASTVGGVLQASRQYLVLGGGVLILGFGLKYLGFLQIEFLERTVQVKGLKTGSRLLDAFLFGVVFAAGWTPCVGPILGSVLTYTAATTSSGATGALHLWTYSMGVGVPLIALSVVAHRLAPKLRKLNRHLPLFEKITGGIMVAAGLALAVPPAIELVGTKGTEAASPNRSSMVPPLGEPSERPRLVEFYSQRCPVCERMAPRIEQLRQDCVDRKVEILTVDISDPGNREVAARQSIHAVPAVKLFKRDGTEWGQLFGERELAELRAAAAALVEDTCVGEMAKTDFSDLPGGPSCESVSAGSEGHDSDAPAECKGVQMQ